MKLELKHLASYLPYKLECKYVDEDKKYILDAEITETNQDKRLLQLFHVLEKNSAFSCKIILRPLSDLTKEIEVNGEKFVSIDKMSVDFDALNYDESLLYLSQWNKDDVYFMHIEYDIINCLFKWHFDVFGLIKEGLAIDINTL